LIFQQNKKKRKRNYISPFLFFNKETKKQDNKIFGIVFS